MQVSAEIIELCIQKDRIAQRKMYEACYSYMMGVCFRYAKSEDEAVEFMNIGFLKVLNGLEKKPGDIPFKYWVRKILINSMIDEFRKSRKYKESTVVKDHIDLEVSKGREVALNEAESKLSVEDIYLLIAQLPEMGQKVFNLYVVDGYNHKEIGEMLGITDGTSKWHLSNSRAKLKDMILQKNFKMKAG